MSGLFEDDWERLSAEVADNRRMIAEAEKMLIEARRAVDLLKRFAKDDRVIQLQFHEMILSILDHGIRSGPGGAMDALREVRGIVGDVAVNLKLLMGGGEIGD